MLIKISDIIIGDRFRKDLGNIDRLAASIKEVGLLHPIVITENNELVCGRRRIAAYEKLNRSEIEANILPSLKLHNLSRAEADENIARKNFSLTEIIEVD